MTSKHPNASKLVQSGLFDNASSFEEIEQRIAVLGVAENTKVMGDAFEIFVEGFLATQAKMQCEDVWLVSQIPADTRKRLNLPNDPKGIDGVFRTRLGSEVPYQVKFRSQRAYLTYTDLAPFLGLTERGTSDRIVFTNSNELAGDVKNRDGVRTVRGIDFDELTREELEAISGWLRCEPIKVERPQPRSYQVEALAKISAAIEVSDRAHVVMACGTGKTLVALWSVESINPKTVLVLVPSLTLLQQTLGEWSKHTSWGKKFSYLCVCSDPTVARQDEADSFSTPSTDLDFRVDTDPAEVRRFLSSGRDEVKVVFCTYQSSRVVSEAVQGLEPFDVAIFDEAHKTTGPKGGTFAHCLSDDNVQIKKRLFFTATPRHYDIRHRDKGGDFRLVSMDDEAIYGSRAYTLTFGSAAKQGIICNYKVVISVVDSREINDFALRHGITIVEGDLVGAKWVASQIAIERAIEKTGAKRAITFHSRVSSAKKFGAEGSRGIKQFLPDFSIFHVNGSQSSAERRQLIQEFRKSPNGLITNARCLTEGIDVPAVDMVAFVDPRQSKIDIAQATGRAMRKPAGSEKNAGYIVVPLFLDALSDEPIADALARSDFSQVADVLNAMQEQDEDLIQTIRELQEDLGRGQVVDLRRLSEKVEVYGPAIELSALRLGIFAEVVDELGFSWDMWFGRLRAFKEREGHCLVPTQFIQSGYDLGSWAKMQRGARDKLSDDRRRRLDELGFVWDLFGAAWEEGFSHLKSFRQREGHCRVPQGQLEKGFRLGSWVSEQRKPNQSLSEDRKNRLDEIEFVWNPRDSSWNDGFGELKAFREREGHCLVPVAHIENGFGLGQWVSRQRLDLHRLSKDRIGELNALGFVWDIHQGKWEQGFESLKAFQRRFGHCRVKSGHEEDGFKLGAWVNRQRVARTSLSEERLQLLAKLGFDWEVSGTPRKTGEREFSWEEGYGHLRAFRFREGHCLVPQVHKENGFKLGVWTHNQRREKHRLSAERQSKLDELGFAWDFHEAVWEKAFDRLRAFKTREGHCRVPRGHREDGVNLAEWVISQRGERLKLSAERQSKLNEIGFIWDFHEAAWDTGFDCLTAFYNREGHCRVPASFKEAGFNLGQWVTRQRRSRDALSTERLLRLNELGFVWAIL